MSNKPWAVESLTYKREQQRLILKNPATQEKKMSALNSHPLNHIVEQILY